MNSEWKKYARRNREFWKCGAKSKPPNGRTTNWGRQSTGKNKGTNGGTRKIWCGNLSEHQEWLTDLERRLGGTLQEHQAQLLDVGRLEGKLDKTEQSMQEHIQSDMTNFVQQFLPPYPHKNWTFGNQSAVDTTKTTMRTNNSTNWRAFFCAVPSGTRSIPPGCIIQCLCLNLLFRGLMRRSITLFRTQRGFSSFEGVLPVSQPPWYLQRPTGIDNPVDPRSIATTDFVEGQRSNTGVRRVTTTSILLPLSFRKPYGGTSNNCFLVIR